MNPLSAPRRLMRRIAVMAVILGASKRVTLPLTGRLSSYDPAPVDGCPRSPGSQATAPSGGRCAPGSDDRSDQDRTGRPQAHSPGTPREECPMGILGRPALGTGP